jgi:hypothetical protein
MIISALPETKTIPVEIGKRRKFFLKKRGKHF